MSTAPTGWQDPKTNWLPPDVVNPTVLNRIEGNINAIETGNRTLDPAQNPTGNIGTLRQFLDWLVNRIKAITGKTNWYDAPSITLEATKTHNHDGTITPNVPWANVSGKPATYPPSAHQHSGGDITTAVANATNAANSDKVDGHHVFVQSAAPTASAAGDIWIQT